MKTLRRLILHPVPLLFALLLLPCVAGAQTPSTLFVQGNNVGVGTENPTQRLHVVGNTGDTQVLVQELSGIRAQRLLFVLQNNGPGIFRLFDSAPDGSRWDMKAEGPSLRINKAGTGGEEIIIRSRLDGSLGQATLTVNGSVQATNVSFTSSRDAKTNFQALDPRAILAKVVSLPITQWEFKSEVNGLRHIGPVAEDFNSAFSTDSDNHRISLIDANGVSLAAIQGLYDLLLEKQDTIEKLRSQNEQLGDRLEALENAVAALTR